MHTFSKLAEAVKMKKNSARLLIQLSVKEFEDSVSRCEKFNSREKPGCSKLKELVELCPKNDNSHNVFGIIFIPHAAR